MEKVNNRLNCLDSLRGIAALIVVLSHLTLMTPESLRDSVHGIAEALHSLPNAVVYAFLKISMASRSAVLLFFVLSGFVLARSLERKTPFFEYLIKRFFRIYPILFFTIITSFFLHKEIGFNHEVSSNWLERICDIDISLKNLLQNLLLWGTTDANKLNGVIWSLVYELRISIIFPFILWSVSKFKLKAVILWMLLSIASTFYVHFITGGFINGYAVKSFALTWVNTIYFIIFFAVGAYLSINSKITTTYLIKIPVWLLVPFSIIVFYGLFKSASGGTFVVVDDYIRGFGAAWLIALAISFKKIDNALNLKIPLWLGHISYSLYLIHIPIIYVIVQTWTSLSLIETAIVVLIISLGAAQIMANLIEFPMNSLGKIISKKLIHIRPLWQKN